MRRASYRSVSGLRINARLDSAHGLPSAMGLDRGAGSWSRQNAVALDGTTFITLGTAEDEPRWDYGSGLEGLLLEPTRTNVLLDSNFVDTAPANDIPDGWGGYGAGADVVDTGAPHGGAYGRTQNAETGGFQDALTAGATTLFQTSFWGRAPVSIGAGQFFYTVDTNPGVGSVALPTGAYDWRRIIGSATTVGAGAAGYMAPTAALTGELWYACPNYEAGDSASSWIPTTGGTATRAAELLTIDPSVVGRYRGDVQIKYRFDYANDAALSVRPCLFPWAAGYEVVFDPADDKIKVVVAGVDRAETAALTFARQSWHDIRVIYGASGQRLIVDGVETTNATAWGDPGVLAPYLNSRAASVNCRPGAIARFTSAWM